VRRNVKQKMKKKTGTTRAEREEEIRRAPSKTNQQKNQEGTGGRKKRGEGGMHNTRCVASGQGQTAKLKKNQNKGEDLVKKVSQKLALGGKKGKGSRVGTNVGWVYQGRKTGQGHEQKKREGEKGVKGLLGGGDKGGLKKKSRAAR